MPGCASEVRTVERLDEIPVRALEEGEDAEAIEVELEDGYTDRGGADTASRCGCRAARTKSSSRRRSSATR